MTKYTPRLEVDLEADAAYVRFSDEPIASTLEVTDMVMVDFDQFRVVVGVEIIGLRTQIPFSRLTDEAHVPSGCVEALRTLMPSIQSSVLTSGSDGVAAARSEQLQEVPA